jgi:hypothetical protein
MKKILITGGAGFIGSHVVRLFANKYPDYHIYNLDKLTYAGNLANLKDVEKMTNYSFIKGDIVDAAFINQLFEQYKFDGVIHLAAESHVDRSISNPVGVCFYQRYWYGKPSECCKEDLEGECGRKNVLSCLNRRSLRFVGRGRDFYRRNPLRSA